MNHKQRIDSARAEYANTHPVRPPLGEADTLHADLCHISRVFNRHADLRDAHDHRANEALKRLIALQSGQMKPHDGDRSDGWRDWSEFEGEIADAISDSLDMDWNSRDGARSVVRFLNSLTDRKTWWFLENTEGRWLENYDHGTFTSDPNAAMRWPNQAAADAARREMRTPLWMLEATEHAWVAAPNPILTVTQHSDEGAGQ